MWYSIAVLMLLVFPPAISAQGVQAKLIREVAIGDNAVPKGFTNIGTVVSGPQKRLYVAQPVDNLVHMFDSTGKFVRSIGGSGSGPGETQRLGNIGFLGDTLWTYDWNVSRFSFFLSDGTYTSTLNVPGIIDSTNKGRPATLMASAPLTNGHLFFGMLSLTSRPGGELMPPVPQVVGTRDGKVVRVVSRTDSIGRGSYSIQSGDRISFTSDPYFGVLVNTAPLAAVGGNGAWFAVARRDECASSRRYTLARTSLAGDTTWKVLMDCPQLAVPPGFIDSIVAVNRDRITAIIPVPASYAESEIRKTMRMQGFSATRDMKIGSDGSLWIRPFTRVGDSIETWIRADSRPGTPNGFTLPPRSQLKAVVDATHVWVVQLDADDLPTLIRYRLD
jgi:hypothetical protein